MRPYNTISSRLWGRLGLMALFVATLAFSSLANSSFAGLIVHGDFSDIPPGDVMYLDVIESSGTDPVPPPLYGIPTITGNLLDFNPPGFVSTATGGPLDVTDGQLNFTLMSEPGTGFGSIAIAEGGDYSFSGTGGAGTTVTANLSIRVEILEIDHTPLLSPIVLTDSDVFMDDMANTGGATAGLLPWDLTLVADLSSALGGATYGVTKAEVVINNQLVSDSQIDSLAFIAKKDFKVTPGPIIPEPATLMLAGLSCALIGLGRRK